MDEDDLIYLLANPFHHKRDETNNIEIERDIDTDIIDLLTQKYSDIEIKKEDYSDIFLKIETLLQEITLQNIVTKVVSNLVDTTIQKYEYERSILYLVHTPEIEERYIPRFNDIGYYTKQ